MMADPPSGGAAQDRAEDVLAFDQLRHPILQEGALPPGGGRLRRNRLHLRVGHRVDSEWRKDHLELAHNVTLDDLRSDVGHERLGQYLNARQRAPHQMPGTVIPCTGRTR